MLTSFGMVQSKGLFQITHRILPYGYILKVNHEYD